jgi:TPR repeat protein
MAKIRTHYDNLKVVRTAPESVIKAAHKALCQTYHPDKLKGSREEAERIIKIINASYTVLIDPVKRKEHDDWIKNKEVDAARKTQPMLTANSHNAGFEQAVKLYAQGRYAEAELLYRYFAEQGNVKAQASLGFMYRTGKGVVQDYKQALYWYGKAAKQGNVIAQVCLGYLYLTGKGTTQNYRLGGFWYRKAAEHGDSIVKGMLKKLNYWFSFNKRQ